MSFTLFVSSDNIDAQVDKITPLVLLEDGGPVRVSHDEGASWQTVLTENKPWKMAISSSDGRIIVGAAAAAAGTDEPLYVYDGKAWSNPPDSYVEGGWRSLAGSEGLRHVAAVADDGSLFLSQTKGLSWDKVSTLSGIIDVAMSSDGTHLVCIQEGVGGYIFVSHDQGQTWTPSINSNGWETITMTEDGSVIVAAENSGYVFVSVNGGTLWSQRPESGHWREVSISGDGSRLIAVRTGTLPGRKIVLSKNLGLIWEEKGVEQQWTSVAMVPGASKVVAVAFNEYPYMSLDGGETWSQRTAAGKRAWACVALSAVSDKAQFEEMDDPPTQMKTAIRLPTLESSRDSQNQRYRIYLEKFFLDCVWRDSERPDLKLTANSGTSKSDKVFVTFYAGDISQNIRLIEQNERSQTGVDCDVILHRDSDHVGEVSSFYEYTSQEVFDANYWFENQYTNQSQRYAAPGYFIGTLNVQALLALRRVPYVTVRLETNRTDGFTSPFWYRKFLTGVSLYNEDTGKYDIVENGTISPTYYNQVGAITLTAVGQYGPYQPASLYTFARPLHEELFDGDLTSVFGVRPSASGSINLMDSAGVEVVMGQVALPPAANDAAVLESYAVPGSTRLASGEFAPHPIYAGSDMQSYRVSTADGAGGWTTTSPSLTGSGATDLLPFPNGSWRGVPLQAQNTAAGPKSPFPWEQRLTADQLQIMDGEVSYDTAMHGTQVLPTEDYLFMPSGDWGQRVGERSLQIDLGKQQFVNKLQLFFPKSQERWQPTRLNATLQRAWPSTNPEASVDVYPSFWHQGFQGRYPYGQNDGRTCKYIHTLSQRWPFNGSEGDMVLGTHTGNLVSTYNMDGVDTTVPVTAYNLPVIVEGSTYANVSTQEVDVSGASTFAVSPNAVNPAFDFKRFEYGPFYQGATLSWLTRMEALLPGTPAIGGVYAMDVRANFPIAVAPKHRPPSWNAIEAPNGFFFSDFDDWISTASSERALGGMLRRWLPTAHSFRFAIPFFGAPDGMFEVSASSGNALTAFDFSDTTFWEAGGYSGSQYVPGPVSSAANYTGSAQTTFYVAGSATPNVVNGEWLQIKLPTPILVDGTLVQPRQVASVWQIANVTSSIDGIIWYPTGYTWSGTGSDETATVVIDASFQKFTMTTSAGKYMGNTYIGTASLPSQRAFAYLPGATPDYTDAPMTALPGEWFAVEFDRPKRIKGFLLSTRDIRQAPGKVALFCQNAGDPYWYRRATQTITDWELNPEINDDNVNGDPRGFTRWAVVVSEVQINYVVEDPAHIFAIYDTFLGKEIRANVEQRAYTSLADLAKAVETAINSETGGQITYTVEWTNAFGGRFDITNEAASLSLAGPTPTAYNFSILDTPLTVLLGFSASSPQATSFAGSSAPPITSLSPKRTTFSITFHEAGETDVSGNGDVVEQDQPTIMRILGSNDGVTWNFVGLTNALNTWRSRGGETVLNRSFFVVGGVRQKRTATYQYFRFVFQATQKSTSVRVSQLTLYAYDYDSPDYAATVVAPTKPVFDLDYQSPNERDDIYKDCYDWLLHKFTLYQIYKGQPLLDFLVKEEYYFAPNVDQKDETSVHEPFGSYRPNYKAVAQKMIEPKLAEGRYAGLAVGYESTNRGYYTGNISIYDESVDAGKGRDHKCFAWRLCHQLYDFYSKGGKVNDKNNGDATKAAFNKRFEMGMLTGVGLVDGGKGYISKNLGDNDVDVGKGTETLVDNETVAAYAKANYAVGANVVVDGVSYTSNVSASAASTYEITVVGLTGSANVIQDLVKTASEKSPLYRKADFLLSFQSS